MIITIGGKPGSGKSTIARLVAKKLGFNHYSAGGFMREMAHERGLSIVDFAKLAEKDESIDKKIDERSRQIAKGDNFVMDTRLGFHFIPKSIKIFLDVDLKEAARRIFKDQRPDEPKKKTVGEIKELLKMRMTSSQKRYKKYYNIDFLDKSNYDLVIDTTKLSKKEVVDRILEFVKQPD